MRGFGRGRFPFFNFNRDQRSPTVGLKPTPPRYIRLTPVITVRVPASPGIAKLITLTVTLLQVTKAAGPLERAGVCCINMDAGTPDDNIFAMAAVVERYRRYGA